MSKAFPSSSVSVLIAIATTRWYGARYAALQLDVEAPHEAFAYVAKFQPGSLLHKPTHIQSGQIFRAGEVTITPSRHLRRRSVWFI